MPDNRIDETELSSRRLPNPDGTLGQADRAPWRKWDILARADFASAGLTAAATFFATLPLAASHLLPQAFRITGPLVGVAFFMALMIQFMQRERHGIARAILIAGAVVLAVGGVVFAGEVSPGRVLYSYWVPALLGVGAATVLVKGHRKAEHPSEGVRVRTSRKPRL